MDNTTPQETLTPERIATAREKARDDAFHASDNCYDNKCLCWEDEDRRLCPIANAALDRLIAFERAEAIVLTNTHGPYNSYTRAELLRTLKAIEDAP